MAPAPIGDDIPGLLAAFDAAGELDRPALSFYRGKTLDGRLSYRELSERVSRLAGRLHHAHGIRPGDRVAILSPNRIEIPALVLALLRLGAVVVPLNPGSAPEDWAYILAHSGARGLAATSELASRVAAEPALEFVLAVEGLFELSGDGEAPPPDPPGALADAPAVVLYTSGTTGHPKGVTLRQRNLLSNAWSMARNFALERSTQLAVLPLYHAHAFGFGLMTALSTGGHLVFTDRLEPFTWCELIRRESVTVSSVVPTLLPQLLLARVTHAQAPTLRHLLVSSAPLPRDLAERFESQTGIPLIQGWGLSEYTNFACCMSPADAPEAHARLLFGREIPSIGPELEGTEVRVVDAAGGTASEGEPGELAIRGHSSMVGYLGDEASTQKVLDEDGWLHTGDEGFFAVEGGRRVFFVTGRIKEIIIRDAEKYSPLALERRLVEEVPELSGRLVVLGFPHRGHGEEVGAYVELTEPDAALVERLLAATAVLPVESRPKIILHGAEAIPRTHTGKIQRRKMQPWFAAFADCRGPTRIATR